MMSGQIEHQRRFLRIIIWAYIGGTIITSEANAKEQIQHWYFTIFNQYFTYTDYTFYNANYHVHLGDGTHQNHEKTTSI